MAYGLAGAHREELKDKQLLSLRTELRSNRLNGSGMNKIVRSRSATPGASKGAIMSNLRSFSDDRIPVVLPPLALRSSSGPILQ